VASAAAKHVSAIATVNAIMAVTAIKIVITEIAEYFIITGTATDMVMGSAAGEDIPPIAAHQCGFTTRTQDPFNIEKLGRAAFVENKALEQVYRDG
jgi:hypothetical protein